MNKPRRWLFLMKITIVQILISSLSMAMVYAVDGMGQEVLNRKISIDVEGTEFQQVLLLIGKQANVKFAYSPELVQGKEEVSLHVENERLVDVLTGLLGPDISYKVIGRQIVLIPVSSKMELPGITQLTVSGTVVSDTGEPIAGVNVLEKGTKNGTTSDANGIYKIEINDGNATLVFSFIGYVPQEIPVGNRSVIDVSLTPDVQTLQEIVVVGYGTVKKSDLTGSVSSVNAEQIMQMPISTIERGLQGRAAGVVVSHQSGSPGEDVIVRIRGANSISGGNNPLYVIDGLMVDKAGANFNPNDVESIEVLKDASSTAIYGSRGANGVVLITTKRGKEGKTRVSYDGSYSMQSIRKKLDLLGKNDFAAMINEVSRNDGGSDIYTEAEIVALPDNDWQDLTFVNAPMQTHQIAVSGGNKMSKIFTSVNYLDQGGIIKNSGFKRVTVRLNGDFKINDKISFTPSLFVSGAQMDKAQYQSADGAGGIPFHLRVMPPITPVFDANGNYTRFTGVPWGATNPVGVANELKNMTTDTRIMTNLNFNYKIINDLLFTVNLGVDNTNSKTDNFTPNTLSFGQPGGFASKGFNQNFNFLNEYLVNYTKDINENHSLQALAGFTYQYFKFDNLSGSSANFLSNAYENNSLQSGRSNIAVSSGLSESTLLSYLGRINYSLMDRYLFTISGRYDGSSKFGADNKFAFFPSAAFAWKISDESFLKDASWNPNLKMRISYGATGNQGISPYQTLASTRAIQSVVGGTQQAGIVLNSFANNTLKWETTRQFDLGFDIGLLRDRISLTIDYYYKKTSDLLFNATLPPSSGFTSSVRNVGEMENKGFEFLIDSKNIVGDFNWSSVFNISFNKQKVLSLGNDSNGQPIKRVDSPIPGGNWFPLFHGEAPFQLYGYKIDGIYNTNEEAIANGEPGKRAGDYKYIDTNADGILSAEDQVQLTKLQPKFTLGFDNTFGYKNFQLSVFIIGSFGNDIVNEFRKYSFATNGSFNVLQEAYDKRWTGPGSSAKYAQVSSRNSVQGPSTLWVEDGSFLKFRDIKLSYNLPATGKVIQNLRLYCSLQNMPTISKYSGYDPEASWAVSSVVGWDRGVYPSTKSWTVGLNASF